MPGSKHFKRREINIIRIITRKSGRIRWAGDVITYRQ
jgi:hypothetical protein